MRKTKKIKTFIALFLLVGVLCENRLSVSRAAEGSETPIMYQRIGESTIYSCTSADEAFRNCYETGGKIWFKEDYSLELGGTMDYNRPRSNIEIIVEEGVTLTIGKRGAEMDGAYLTLNGTLDLNAPGGELKGYFTYTQIGKQGKYIKKKYDFQKKEEECLAAKEIVYGQSLSEAEIVFENIYWTNSVEGTWSFVRPEHIPQAGVRRYDVTFTPKHSLTYDPATYPSGGLVTVQQARPEMTEYQIPHLHVGQALREAKPVYVFRSPITGEEVKGTLSFEEANQIFTQSGEQSVMAIFTPEDLNYAVTEQVVKVKVESVTPKLVTKPASRKNGETGQTLQEIPILDGTCINPYTGQKVKGDWEWKYAATEIKKGQNYYPILFIPEESGYQRLELSVPVTGQEKKTETETEEEIPIIITQMVSRISDIQMPKTTVPGKTTIQKIKRIGNKVKISCRKVKKARYEVQYGTNKNWKKVKKKYSTGSVITIKKLSRKKKYYFRVRTWDKKKKVHSKWSKVKRG
ncbi:MAG: hypothetical protein J1F22_07270 [Lachnospiraceae bacterium]|nr:hypothetical protein [Lachnospiraceae bacterium]